MMISYLGIGFSRQAVVNYNIPDLFLPRVRLQVKDFGDSVARKYVVAAFDALLKPQALQKLHHAGKRDICISAASQNLVEKFVRTRHGGLGAEA